MATETGEKSEYDDLAREIVRAQMSAQKEQAHQAAQQKTERENAAPGGWNRPFRSWEGLVGLIVGFCAIATFLILYFMQPILGLRDDNHDMKAAQATLLKTVTNHEDRLHTVELQTAEIVQLKDIRGKRLADVEDAVKSQQGINAQMQGQIIELKAGQQQILTTQQAIQAAQMESGRKLDDLLSRKH